LKFDALVYGGILEPRGSSLTPLKYTFNVKISYTGCLGLSRVVSAQFTLKMCIETNHKTSIRPIWGSRSFKVIDVGSTANVTSSACYDNSASLCLSATVLTLDQLIVVK